MTRVSVKERTPRLRRGTAAGLLGLAVGAATFVAGAGIGAAAQTIQATPRVVLVDSVFTGEVGTAKPVTIHNGGDAPLHVTGLTIGGTDAAEFSLVSPPALPATVAPGADLVVPVVLAATTTGPKGADLTIASDAPGAPSTVVTLRGLGTVKYGGSNEPSLQWIFDTFQIPNTAGNPDPSMGFLDDTPGLAGDEVALPMFEAAGPGPVTIEHMATFGQKGPAANQNVVTLGYYTGQDGSGKQTLFDVPNASYQSLAGSVVGSTSFAPPSGTFGFYTLWHGPTFANEEVYSIDALNLFESNADERHKVRIYPYKSPEGVQDNTAYVVAFEESPTLTDYNDLVFVVRNVREPGADTDRPTVLSRTPAAGATNVAVNADVTVGFSESMNGATVSAANFTLAPTAGGAALPGTITATQDGTGFTLNPTADLTAGTSYTVTVTTGASDSAGNQLAANDTWAFTTAGTAPPGPGPGNGNTNTNTNTNGTGGTNPPANTDDGKPKGADRAFCARYPQASTVFARQLTAAKLAKAKAKTAGARAAATKRIAAITKKQRAANARYAAVNCKSVATELFCEAYPKSSKALAKQVAAAKKARAKAITPAAKAAAAKKVAKLIKQQKAAVNRHKSC